MTWSHRRRRAGWFTRVFESMFCRALHKIMSWDAFGVILLLYSFKHQSSADLSQDCFKVLGKEPLLLLASSQLCEVIC